ncbi:hypothetical protein H0H81_008068 [Sphagnurus paluster]|uniref:Cytochrome P450 n=1 Tax=Sphagnurus paluster TaxID=117069 RepID=A0A9P7GK86_9AGAR|nr:hypothetical protein H0H81_008068 [Sphagnurus paluster]
MRVAPLAIRLTRNLPFIFPEMREEMVSAFNDVIPQEYALEWQTISAADGITEIIGRLCNRVILGPHICREPAILALKRQLIKDKADFVLDILPEPLSVLIAGLRRRTKKLSQLLKPTIQLQQRVQKESPVGSHYRTSSDAQNTILSSLIAETSTPHTPYEITRNIIALNLQAVSTTSLAFTHALYHLAASNTHVVQPMREEIQAALRGEGWTLHALERMHRIDSFLKESMRLSGLHALTMHRESRKPYVFSGGTHIPTGAHLAAACASVHTDAARYASPETFDATRFVRAGSEGAPRYQLTTTGLDFLAWGHGRAACPGRFFAAAVMKMMLAYVVLEYDVRLSEGDAADGSGDVEARRPRDIWVGYERIPDLHAELLFRKRKGFR